MLRSLRRWSFGKSRPAKWLAGSMASLSPDDRGSMLPLMALLLLMTTAGAALAVDVTRAFTIKVQMQSAADAAALAAAIKLPDLDAARKAGMHYAARNLPAFRNVLRAEDFEFGHWHARNGSISSDESGASAVRLTLRLTDRQGNGLKTLFAGVFGGGIIDIEASAAAGKQGVACLIALDAAGNGIEIKGEAELDLVGCSAQSNATDNDSLKVSGSVRMTTGGICVSGRAKIDAGADVTPTPIEYCPQQPDPMAGFIAPAVGGCTDNGIEYKDEVIALTAGRVFCDGLKLTGTSRVTLQPGVYVIDNGKLEIGDDAVLEGDGVTILLHGEKAELDIKGRAAVRLTAPTTGDLQGLLIVQDQGGHKDNKWVSSARSELTGVVYLPDGRLTSLIESNLFGMDACFVLIASEIKLDSKKKQDIKAKMAIDLTSTACRKALPTAFSRAVALLA